MTESPDDERVHRWLVGLDGRHLADLTPTQVARSLRALSSCYVERRSKLSQGAALDGAGKRAAFALFYAPLHFFVVRHIVGHVDGARAIERLVDLGCGTGAAGAGWAIECVSEVRLSGFDLNPWAVEEANWTYRQLGVAGRAARGDVARSRIEGRPGTGILAAYVVNELDAGLRTLALERLRRAHDQGARVLVVEPIARRLSPWWPEWEAALVAAGGQAHEWRLTVDVPERQRGLARAAGLDLRELTARSLWV